MNSKGPAKPLTTLAALVLAHLAVPQVQAGMIEANGVLWELSSTAQPGVSTTGVFTLSATMDPGWTGSDTAWLGAFSLKNFGSNVTITTAITVTGGSTWEWINRDINANGCKSTPVTNDALCVYLSDGTEPGNVVEGSLGAASPNTSANFSFSFEVTALDVFPEFLHLKVTWYEQDCKTTGRDRIEVCGWKKAESLISDDLGYDPGPDPDPDPDPDPKPVPIPGTIALLGLGLVGLGAFRRRNALAGEPIVTAPV